MGKFKKKGRSTGYRQNNLSKKKLSNNEKGRDGKPKIFSFWP
jgi:hypothetical protein